MKLEKEYGLLTEFKGRDVELFRSSNPNATAIYFTKVKNEDREDAKAYFELLRFGMDGGDHQIYIKYPKTDHFVEMVGGGSGSGRGDMKQASGKNVWEREHNQEFNINSHDDDLILLFGRKDWCQEFNFMKRVAKYDKGNKFDHPYPNETFRNYEEIEKVLSLKYLKIPEHIKTISYFYKTQDKNPTFFLVDFPKYKFKYNNQRFFMIKGKNYKEFEIKSFDRYRDGGTTFIKVLDENNVEHTFFSPTSLGEKKLVEKWDDIELIEGTKEELSKVVEMLSINLSINDEE